MYRNTCGKKCLVFYAKCLLLIYIHVCTWYTGWLWTLCRYFSYHYTKFVIKTISFVTWKFKVSRKHRSRVFFKNFKRVKLYVSTGTTGTLKGRAAVQFLNDQPSYLPPIPQNIEVRFRRRNFRDEFSVKRHDCTEYRNYRRKHNSFADGVGRVAFWGLGFQGIIKRPNVGSRRVLWRVSHSFNSSHQRARPLAGIYGPHSRFGNYAKSATELHVFRGSTYIPTVNVTRFVLQWDFSKTFPPFLKMLGKQILKSW